MWDELWVDKKFEVHLIKPYSHMDPSTNRFVSAKKHEVLLGFTNVLIDFINDISEPDFRDERMSWSKYQIENKYMDEIKAKIAAYKATV